MLNNKRPRLSFAVCHGDTMIGFAVFEYQTAEENERGDEIC
jgi:hypothetical protein